MFLNSKLEHNWDNELETSWYYFFSSHCAEQLEYLVELLTPKGFTLVAIYTIDHGKAYTLHVEKFEAHTLRSLTSRNNIFRRIAQQLKHASYDGVDISPMKTKNELPWWQLLIRK